MSNILGSVQIKHIFFILTLSLYLFCAKILKVIILNIQEMQKYCINKLKENNIEDYNLKTKLLICKAINKPKEYLIIHNKEEIGEGKILEIKRNVNKIIEGLPIQYITENQEFMGLNFFVNENVLIPQPDTEILVEEVLSIAKEFNMPRILDLCTGSGAIAISLKKCLEAIAQIDVSTPANTKTKITASDISKDALKVAQINAKNNNVEIEFIESDLFENINKKFDIIVSNPPYIKTDVINKLSIEVQNEPHLALDGGQDGLDFYREIINNAYKYLESDGYLALEIGYDQKDEVVKLIKNSNKYKEIYSKKDFAGNDRIIVCKRR